MSGAEIPEMRFGPIGSSQSLTYADASLDDNPIHLDRNTALAVGLDGPVVHGMLIMGLLEQVLTNWRSDFQVTRLHAAFVRPVLIGAEIAIGGRVVQTVPGAEESLLHVRLLVRADEGKLVCVGEASGKIARRTRAG